MDDVVIRVESVSKRYVISHQGKTRPSGFRELVSQKAAAVGRRLRGATDASAGQTQEEFWALRDVSFEIKRGEVLGIIGRNGAGKSTMLKILSRITEPTSGRIGIRGRVASLLEVGTGFHPELTGRENIFLNGAILGMTKAEITSKFDEIVAFAEVERFLDTPVKRYSSGMYVRLAFAVAAHLEPEILIVDEVLAVGDAQFQKKCLGKIGDVANTEGRTVLFVSHNMVAVTQLCKRAIWLKDGAVEADGPPDQVVRGFLSANSSQSSKRTWTFPGDAPGDDFVRLLGCRLVQSDATVDVLDVNEPARVEFDFQVLATRADLVTGVYLYNESGMCLFGNLDWRPNDLRPGRYQKHVVVPPQLLAEGKTTITMCLYYFDPFRKCVELEDALVFEAIDSVHPKAVRGPHKGTWIGAVRPALDWSDARESAAGEGAAVASDARGSIK